MSARTSLTHPLIINPISVSAGELGLTFCPGKKQPNAMTGSWDRDITLDIATIKSWGADAIISLLEDFEHEELQVPELPAVYQREFKTWYNLPIQDKNAPNQNWLENWLAIRGLIHTQLNNGEKIMIHCKGGFGRTGTVAAMILMDFGYSVTDAIIECRKARELSVETLAQEQFLMDYSQLRKSHARR
ncbi:cyclin-dependent kinase inhibitor 3 family protein [Cellvibrio sp. UBA7661]|uniref:cyclin-dependent kinase inhibitor 3 family protein n=1 Tax=Cellvibrio sp. UBA7661 TaxID=1946311 RepID=UPI002F353466